MLKVINYTLTQFILHPQKVVIFCDSLNGTASYSFPTSFINTPVVINTNGLSVSLVTSILKTSVTITGTNSTGFLFIEGY
jgi:hypothetical protein